jgi:phosphoribosylamine--glycine ligase
VRLVNETGIYLLEFTLRFGYPTIALQEEFLESPTGQLFHDLAHGPDPRGPQRLPGRGAGRPVAVPVRRRGTYDESSRNAAIVFDTPDGTAPEAVHIEDAKGVDGQWRAAGESGMTLVVTGKGETMAAAREQAYDRVDSVLLPNCYSRDDIGERWSVGDGDRLQAWGYLGP